MSKSGSKSGGQTQKPNIAKDTIASTSYGKMLYGLCEGEIYGLVDGGKSIYLNGTPLLDANGNPNFDNVTWDFRSGTNEQEYIKGFPDVSNETGVNVELTQANPWVQYFNNSDLDAIRVRLKFGRLATTKENGDVVGVKIQYAIDLQTDGGAYQRIHTVTINDKASAGYQRSDRIDLPTANDGWNVRVTRLTPNSESDFIQDKMYIDAYAEVIDAKFCHPNTAVIAIKFDAETFNGVPKVSVDAKGKIIRVPSNYDPVNRTYTGLWDGTFKQAYTNNPAWQFYDACVEWRYGLGDHLEPTMIDKWSLYSLGQYCDEMVSDGKGGTEPRFTCNLYLQKAEQAYKVLSNIAGIFRAMMYWNGEQIVLDADTPKDPSYLFTQANIIQGSITRSGARARDRHTIAKVAWSNPENNHKTDYVFVRDEKAIAYLGIRVLDISAIGCTSEGQAQRVGEWALKTEQLETQQLSFAVGLDGQLPDVGNIIEVADSIFAGRSISGRVSAVSAGQFVVTVDRDIQVNAGDTLIVNGGHGKSEKRTISSIDGRRIRLTEPFTRAETQNAWAVESDNQQLMQFRVMSVKEGDDNTYEITSIQHEPAKYEAIDSGADVKPTGVNVNKPKLVPAPKTVSISSRHRIAQAQTVATLVIEWSQVSEAIAYDVEWRKDDDTWVKLPRTRNISVDLDGVYSGDYQARVTAVSANDAYSKPITSQVTAIKAKAGRPDALANLTATGILFGMRLNWQFAAGSEDADYVEIQIGSAPNTNVTLLGQYSYPTNTTTINGLQGNLTQYYRARVVDKLGFKSDWTEWVHGTTDASADKVLDLLNGQLTQNQLHQDLSTKINKIETNEQMQQELQEIVGDANSGLVKNYNDAKQQITQEIADRKQALAPIQTKLDGVYAELNPPMAGDPTRYVGDPTAYVGVWTEKTARLEGDRALGLRLDAVTASFNDSLAFVRQKTEVTADKYSSLATQVNVISAAQSGNLSLVMNEFYTKTDTNIAIANGLSAFRTDFVIPELNKKASATALEETKTKVERIGDNLTVATQKLDGVYSELNPPMAGDPTRYVGDPTAYVGVWTEKTARLEGDRALGLRLDAVVASFGDSNATIEQKYKTLATETTAQAQQITTLESSTQAAQDIANRADATANTNRGLIQQEQKTSSDERQAIAENVETLQTTVGEHTASIQETAETLDGVSARYTMKLDVNGRVSGMVHGNNGEVADLVFSADKFVFAGVNGSLENPFYMLTTPQTINGTTLPAGFYLDAAFISNASIGTLHLEGESVIVTRVQVTPTPFEFHTIDTEEVINAITVDAKGGAVAINFGFEGLEAKAGGDNDGSNGKVIIRIRRGSKVIRTLTMPVNDKYVSRTERNRDGEYYNVYKQMVKERFITLTDMVDNPPSGNQTYTVTLESRGLNAGKSASDLAINPVVITHRSFKIMGCKR